MSLIEIGRGLLLVCRDGLTVHGDAGASPGREQRRLPVDALAAGRAALLARLGRGWMAEQSARWQRRLVDTLFVGGFGCGMAHVAPGGTGQQ